MTDAKRFDLPDFQPLTASFNSIAGTLSQTTATLSGTLREWTPLARLAQGEPMNDDDAMIARNRRLATNMAAGSDVCTLDEVLDTVRSMGAAMIDVPGPRAVQIVDEVFRLRALLGQSPDTSSPR